MIMSILYIILALFGIGVLVFIHEMGHYLMARRVGITVLAFSIGFGKPLVEWTRKGVKWRICVLPFGGYVQMEGMDKKGALEPYQIKGGFFAAKPWDRIKVALAGPLANILFTLVAFAILWWAGGREKPFSQFTHHIGWVERESGLYDANVRAGDLITKLNGRDYNGFTDFLYAVALDKGSLNIEGQEVDYWTGSRSPFNYTFPKDKNFNVLFPAQYILVAPEEIPADSPMAGSGIEAGDRILWVDGELIFSLQQLIQVINSPYVLLTVERGGETFLTRVPRLKIGDFRLATSEKEEFDDWRYEAKLKGKVEQLAFIPYNLTSNGVVEGAISFVDEKSEIQDKFEGQMRSNIEIPLKRGDKIVAIQGKKIKSSYQLLKEMQTKQCVIAVQKKAEIISPTYKAAEEDFEASFEIEDLEKLIQSVGTELTVSEVGDLRLLNPVTPIPLRNHPVATKGKKAKSVDEKTFKEEKLPQIASVLPSVNRLSLNIKVSDKKVWYNVNPFVLFGSVFKETYRTLYALVTGFLSPKNISGPVGIVQVMHHSWSVGPKEALFWLGMISLNLAVLNLLPLPVLDGGHIAMSAVEMVTKKPLKAKTMQRLILPFIILLIGFFIYLTYNDIVRLITSLFS